MEFEIIWTWGYWVFGKVSKNGQNGMVMPIWFFTLHLGVVFWLWVSMDHVVKVSKSHFHCTCLGRGLLEDLKKGSILSYKRSGRYVVQIILVLKEEVLGMENYSSPEFMRIYGDA